MSAHDFDSQPRTNDVKIVENVSFQSLLLPTFIAEGLLLSGFRRPSPIQLSAIPLARCGLDLIVQARSGTGKTLVFTIAALETIKVNSKRAQVIILAPTREIALQITDVITTVSHNGGLKCLKVATVIGGIHLDVDRKSLPNSQIIVGTPGRVRHLISEKLLDAGAVRLFVLDEADKLFDQVFQNDINFIFNNAAPDKQTIACSATFTPELLQFTNTYMQHGKHVLPDNDPNPVLLGLKKLVYLTEDHFNSFARIKLKQEALFNLLDTVRFNQCLVFTNYVSRADSLCTMLRNRGWGSVFLTSQQTQHERIESIKQLKSQQARILVTTDLAARGIDASDVNLVINMDTPINAATYLHRMGRAGRFGSLGLCISIVTKGVEKKQFQNLLFDIGGQEMFVSVIPENYKDVWKEDYEEKIYGIEKEESPISSCEESESEFESDSSLLLLSAPQSPKLDEWVPVSCKNSQNSSFSSCNESEYSLPISNPNEWIPVDPPKIERKSIEKRTKEISTSDESDDLCSNFETKLTLSHDVVIDNEIMSDNNFLVPNQMYWYSKINESIKAYVKHAQNLNEFL